MEQQNISQAEWQVMRVLWAYPHSRSTEVVERLEAEHLENSWRTLLDNMCNTKHGDLVVSILESNQFSQTDLSRILDVVKEKQVQAPKRVQCNCPPGQCTCGRDCQDEMNRL